MVVKKVEKKKTEKPVKKDKSEMKIFNTLTRKVEEIKPLKKGEIGMYSCGPTVYGRAHVGNMRAYIFADTLRRTLEYYGYKVTHVMNITDVGHLTSDADTGEDKMQKSAREERLSAWDISKKYTDLFFKDEEVLNIKKPHIICKATDHIKDQIELVKSLEKKGYTYKTSDGVYFDTGKFEKYGDFAKLNIEGLQAGKRIDVGEKRNKTDFALWKFSGEGEKRDMEWESPWGKGFPGWHIECSAMSMKYLGKNFDIHTGGIDHIPIHHTNEIAQSECSTGKRFVNYWVHSDFLVLGEQEKMSKSLGNVINLDTIREKGFEPLEYRYLCLGVHYRKRLIFGEELLKSASNSMQRLRNKILEIKENAKKLSVDKLSPESKKYLKEFRESVFNDLNTPKGIAVMWNMLGEGKLDNSEKYSLLLDFDKVLGLELDKVKKEEVKIDSHMKDLLKKREEFRKLKKWGEADKIRDEILEKGYVILDTSEGPKLEKSGK
jgi:cysteinyl-tRNA synthetase